jgi:3-phytase
MKHTRNLLPAGLARLVCGSGILLAGAALLHSCQTRQTPVNTPADASRTHTAIVEPRVVTEPVVHDSDDPAIWIHPTDPAQSLVIGTDKDSLGGLYVFDLDGKILRDKSVTGLGRPNNVDVAYGLMLNGKPVDIAVTTERYTRKLRIFSLPDMQPLDNGGIPVFAGEPDSLRALMGIALYKRPSDGAIFAIVGRKEGPTEGSYLWQYRLSDNGRGQVQAELVRKFGRWSGVKEIEAIAVDDQLGYVYYSDEQVGVRKYYADPAQPAGELALFATEGFTSDHEGIAIYPQTDSTGYLIVSDQQANQMQIFSRTGTETDPHDHPLLKVVRVAAQETDGIEVTPHDFGGRFPGGLFIAMSDDRTFHFYAWDDIMGSEGQLP